MENIDLKNHSNLFNKFYCIIENSDQLDLYYKGISNFLKYKFKKILIKENEENKKEKERHIDKHRNNIDKYILNTYDIEFININISKIIIKIL